MMPRFDSGAWRVGSVTPIARVGFMLSLLGCGLAANGCSFEKPGAGTEMNSCVYDSDCASKHCEAGLCVMTGAKPLNVTLEVTPKRMPDGSQPFPIVSAPFALQSGGKMSFELHLPIPVPVRIHNDDRQVDAQVTFRPDMDSNLTAKSTQITTGSSGPTAAPSDVSALLLSGVTYNVFVQPIDPRQPPYTTKLDVPGDAQGLDVDYAKITWVQRKFVVRNAPPGQLTLRARALVGGQLVSNSAPVGSNPVTLSFDPNGLPYQVEINTSEPARTTADNAQCAQSAALIPTFSVAASDLTADSSDKNVLAIQLPTLPEALAYSGTVSLCANQTMSANSGATTLPMAFKTTALYLGSTTSKVSASFQSATQATWSDDDKTFTFCTRVLPGDYVVIVTPPANVTCEIFAERRTLAAQSGVNEYSGVTLTMRTPATLSGKVVTPDGMPMANASVDLIALGISDVTLAVDDPTVPLFNRSRQGTSAADGTFKIQPDVGSYDVVVKPPAQSNFAWRILYDVDVASRTAAFATVVELSAPVSVSGALHYTGGMASDQSTLASADVHAYTIVNEGEPSARSVEIARTQADDNGKITLLMSPDLQKSWIPQ
jgi:hypothetical protein